MLTDEDETVNQANAPWACSKERHHRGTVQRIPHRTSPTTLKRLRSADLDPCPGRGAQEYTQPSTSRPVRSTCGDRKCPPWHQVLRAPRLIMDDAELTDASTCASCAAWSIPPICRSTSPREILQQSKDIDGIPQRFARARCRPCWKTWPRTRPSNTPPWEAFAAVLKEGVGEDFANKEKIAILLRFAPPRPIPGPDRIPEGHIGRAGRRGQRGSITSPRDSFNVRPGTVLT